MTEPYVLHGPLPTLDRPVLVVHFGGWIDASGAGAAAMAALADACHTEPLATFDSDLFVDYRARRPIMELRDGVNTRLVWSELELRHGTDPRGNAVLTLTGPEPDSQWKGFAAAATRLALQLGAYQMVSLGAYPFALPHTRASRLSCTSPSAELIANTPYEKSNLDVPAGMSAVLEHAFTEAGIPSLGLWAQVPHYVSAMSYPASSVALLRGLRESTGIDVPIYELEREALVQRQRIDQLVEGNDEHGAMVRQLEVLYDQAERQAEQMAAEEAREQLANGDLPTGDDLAAEFERFLRDQGD